MLLRVRCHEGVGDARPPVYQLFIEAVESLDYDAMDHILDESYLGIGPSRADSINKENAIINWKNNVENLYEKTLKGWNVSSFAFSNDHILEKELYAIEYRMLDDFSKLSLSSISTEKTPKRRIF